MTTKQPIKMEVLLLSSFAIGWPDFASPSRSYEERSIEKVSWEGTLGARDYVFLVTGGSGRKFRDALSDLQATHLPGWGLRCRRLCHWARNQERERWERCGLKGEVGPTLRDTDLKQQEKGHPQHLDGKKTERGMGTREQGKRKEGIHQLRCKSQKEDTVYNKSTKALDKMAGLLSIYGMLYILMPQWTWEI